MTPQPARATRLARRTSVLLAAPLASLALAGPVAADVPEGWSDPDNVSTAHALLVLGGVPLLLFLAITALMYVPAMMRGERVAAGAPAVENQWLGGPRKRPDELAGPDTEGSEAGGASVRW